MEWIIWVLIIMALWILASVISLALIMATGIRRDQCTCLGDYDDDYDRTCVRCHE